MDNMNDKMADIEWRKTPEALARGRRSMDPRNVAWVFIYRDKDGLKAHFAHERRYTKKHMEGSYGSDITFVSVGHKQYQNITHSYTWIWDDDTTDYETRDVLGMSGLPPGIIDFLMDDDDSPGA